MKDQAERLRYKMKNTLQTSSDRKARTIAIASGKGGVGKSNFTLNFALQLIKSNKQVLIFDLDVGMGNIDILIGHSPKHTFVDLFQENMAINDIIEQGPNSLSYIAGGSGLSHIFQLDQEKFAFFQSEFEKVSASYDYILFDMGAGATNDSLNFISSADEAIVVTTPEPTSITDGYAMIKHLIKKDRSLPIKLLVNRSLNDRSGKQTFERLEIVVQRFLNVEISSLGTIPDDRSVVHAVTKQIPYVIDQPDSKASRALEHITMDYLKESPAPSYKRSFVQKLKRLVFVR